MHRLDRIGGLVLTFAVIALYIGIANLLNGLSLASLPLGTIDAIPIMVINVAILNLYVIHQRKRAQTKPSPQQRQDLGASNPLFFDSPSYLRTRERTKTIPSDLETTLQSRRRKLRRWLKIAFWVVLFVLAFYLTIQGYLPPF